ncbi:SNF2 helicase-associated domain-containing protein [Micromonospora peucetia]|uniref:SNF2 helicase-associated domain-containing protein n=1 Tax=Micromonospora peucetia TaxID=47871 RepID=UPI00224E6C37|nr:SNF2 helicase-associated domain-containing protein [Micromonospora peucetia]MCX4391052.1 SNF2 helicase-associated domain-containing protein [Micromonospora peucetia]
MTIGSHAVTFTPADPPRAGVLLVWSPDGDAPPGGPGDPVKVTLATPPHGQPASVPARRVSVATGVPLLLAGPATDPAAAFWAAAAREALHLAARGLLLPAVTPTGHDTWRVGPLTVDDEARQARLAAAMPATARATPVPGRTPAWLPDPARLLRDFLDAVADTLPRDDAATCAWSALPPTPVGRLRDWAARVAADADAAIRLSLRLEHRDTPYEPWLLVAQAHRRTTPGLLTDTAALWRATAPGFPPGSRNAALLALRHAARVWPPLAGLLEAAVPDALTLADTQVVDLATGAATRLAAEGVDVHWPAGLDRDLTTSAVLRAPARAGGGGLLAEPGDLTLHWRLSLHGTPLTPAELALLADAHRPVVRLRERWVLVPPELARRAREPRAASRVAGRDARPARRADRRDARRRRTRRRAHRGLAGRHRPTAHRQRRHAPGARTGRAGRDAA